MSVDWQAVFGFGVSPWEMVVRGTAMYWFLFLLFRVVIKRRVGTPSIGDLLILVIIADASQNAMAGEYTSVGEGMVLVGTIVAWSVLVDWLAFRFPALEELLQPPPLLLVRKGRILRHNLRAELMSEAELRAKLRENGVLDPAEVDAAYLESDGKLSIIRRRAPGASPG